ASKGRMAGNFNNYLVWSDLMVRDLLEFYPRIRESNIRVVGTPQFEPYVQDRFGYSKEGLFQKFSLKLNKPLLFFTCNDASSENDIIYLERLAEFIEEGKLIKEVNLVVRTSPAEDPKRFHKIKKRFPAIVWNVPDWEITRSK